MCVYICLCIYIYVSVYFETLIGKQQQFLLATQVTYMDRIVI